MSKNKNIIITDNSQNIIDPSFRLFSYDNKNNNRYFTPLQHWKDEKTPTDNKLNKLEQNSINRNNFIFSMGLDGILNNMRDSREENYRDISYKNIVNYLDNRPLLLKNDVKKDNWKNWLENINKKYKDIYSGNPVTPNVLMPHYSSVSYKKSNLCSMVRSISPPKIPPPPPPPKKVEIDVEINTLKDILQLCKDYPIDKNIEYNINMKAIHSIKIPLEELDNMIGMNALKLSIMDQILYFIQNLHKTKNKKNNDFMHTVIYGPPGTGKTEVAKIMGKIFSKMGVLSRNVFRKATRADLIAGYLGQTAIKTKDLVRECLGGVLFIDEAYALGNNEKRDSFAKECIDTLCEALSDHKDNLMVIIAGYEKELKDCFFGYNQGLDSRFTWRFKTTDYTADELKAIFEKKVRDAQWDFKTNIPIEWFEKNNTYFKFFGRDMETLFAKTKIAHGRRIFCKQKQDRKKITLKDLEKGFEMYCKNSEVKERHDTKDQFSHLYL